MTLDATAGPAIQATPKRIRVLFVSTGNSVRSQLAEAILRRDAGDRFDAFSGGTDPRPVSPMTEQVLDEVGIEHAEARAKPVSQFLGKKLDYVITLCDRARVACPIFPGGAQILHWGLDDPDEVNGSDEAKLVAYRRAMTELSRRIRAFVPLATIAVP